MMSRLKLCLLAGTVGMSGCLEARSADMPGQGRSAGYVKICNAYGDGYYFVPGSDTCVKFGGYIRADYGLNTSGGRNPAYGGTQGAQDRTVPTYSTRHRANLSVDVRTPTEYGVLRSMTSLHLQNENQTETFNVARAFVQWAGFTLGRTKSYSDTWSLEADWHYATQQNQSDTGANGTNQIAYTYDAGAGITMTIGADERRSKSLANLSRPDAIKVGAEPSTSVVGQRWPDVHADLHINQEWGFWALSFLVHDVSAISDTADPCGNPGCGHPDDRVGWVVMEGGEIKLPLLGSGDRIGYFAHYGQGTTAYSGGSVLTSAGLFGSGNQVAVGWMTDGIYANGTAIELTTSWTVAAGYEHYWSSALSTSVFGAFTSVSYDDAAKDLFARHVCPGTRDGGQAGFNLASGQCDPDWHYLQVGARVQWVPTPGWRMGIEGVYTRVYTAFEGATARLSGVSTSATSGQVSTTGTVVGARPAGMYSINDQATWALVVRVQRNFNTATLQ